MTTTTRVVLADDHAAVRSGIRFLLERAPDITVVGEASNGIDALRLAKDLVPDVLLLDMEMPGMKGVEVARQLQTIRSPVRVLALSAYDDKQYILGLLASGASGYLIKEEAPDIIVEAVRGVSRGERGWVSRRVAAQMAIWEREEQPEKLGLTDREMSVLQLIMAGKSNQEIAMLLDTSESTVERHLDGLYAKLGVMSRSEATAWAARQGLDNTEVSNRNNHRSH